QTLINQYGADTVRLFAMFAARPEQSLEWSDAGVEGAFRFIERLWRLVAEHVESGVVAAATSANTDAGKALRRELHESIAKVDDDIGRGYTCNTATAANMEVCFVIGKFSGTDDEAASLRQEELKAVVRK